MGVGLEQMQEKTEIQLCQTDKRTTNVTALVRLQERPLNFTVRSVPQQEGQSSEEKTWLVYRGVPIGIARTNDHYLG